MPDELLKSDPPGKTDRKTSRIKAWSLVITAVGGLITGVAALVAALNPSQAPKQAYELLKKQIEVLDDGIQQNHEDNAVLRARFEDFVRLSGVPATSASASTPIASAPRVRRPRTGAGSVMSLNTELVVGSPAPAVSSSPSDAGASVVAIPEPTPAPSRAVLPKADTLRW